MLKGIAASKGIVISKVFKLEKIDFNVEKINSDFEVEKNRLTEALEASREDILAIKEAASTRLAAEDLAVFDAHIMFTQDPEFLSSIEDIMKEESVNAEFALDQVANQFISMFEAMDDAYFRERAADLKDVSYRIMAKLQGIELPDLSLINEEVVIVAYDLTPSDTAQLNRQFVKGFATEIGGRTSHSAIMARSLEIPAIVGTETIMGKAQHGDLIILDALKGEIILNPSKDQIDHYQKLADEYADLVASLQTLKNEDSITQDGHEVELAANIGSPDDLEAALSNGAEAIGLYRTEFLYMDNPELPSEEEQYQAYKKVLEGMQGKPVVVRTLDIGGDKELDYLEMEEEMNPFLGHRAIRFCLDRTDIFRTQIRALLRASVYGNLRIMFPMIATLDELRDAKAIVESEKKNLSKEGIAYSNEIQIGIMVEIPSVAVMADQFAKEVDFFSIGTNDLIQYTMAADRMNEKVSYLYQPYNPAILRLVKMVIDAAHKENIWCGMCGEMAGEEQAVEILLGLGLDEFSMSATSILPARKIIRETSFKKAQEKAEKTLRMRNQMEVLEYLEGK